MKLLKSTLTWLLLCIMVLSLAACGGGAGETAEQAFNNGLNAIKTQNLNEIRKYFASEDILGQNDEENQLLSQDENLALMLKNLNYKVVSSSESGDQATIVAEISNMDLAIVLRNYFSQAMEFAMRNAFSNEEISEEELTQQMEDMMVELLKAEDNEMVTTTVEVTLTKVDGNWTIDASDELLDAVFGGLLTALSGLTGF